MKRSIFVFLFLISGSAFSEEKISQWILETSTITYHVSHLLHQSEGKSHSAKGKGECGEKGCQFLVAAPVNSFVSGDTNRDLHMLQTTKGAQFPIVSVNTIFPTLPENGTITSDLEITFAGETIKYTSVPFKITDREKNRFHVNGTIPMKIKDFKIVPPALLAVEIKNEVPVDVELEWTQL